MWLCLLCLYLGLGCFATLGARTLLGPAASKWEYVKVLIFWVPLALVLIWCWLKGPPEVD